MVDRLVLGCGDLCLSIVPTIRSWQGDLLVVDPDERRVDHLRDRSITAETGDITDPEAITGQDFDPDVIFVLTEYRSRAAAAAEAAHEAFPGAYLLSLPGETAQGRAPPVVDRVLSPGALLLDSIEGHQRGDIATRLVELRNTLTEMGGSLAICTHDNPDPDALGAALALRAIADRFDLDATICYYGDISHQENRAFVNLLDVDLCELEAGDPLEAEHVALVDHSRPGVNNQLPADTPIAVVIDHHSLQDPPEATFVDVRSDVGATSTLLVEYLEGYGIDVATDVATGLLYGIRVDTRNFGRETTRSDLEAAAWLLPKADLDALERIESPSVSASTLETIGEAIRNRRMRAGVLSSGVGHVQSRDAIAQAADRLLGLEGVDVTVVYGYRDGTIHLSGRARGGAVDLGRAFRRAFDDIGSAGGHGSMAGAQIPLGVFGALDESDTEAALSMVEGEIEQRLEETLVGTLE
ncbi:MAG: bifunctional oligoribonuclease/PAP phosphatase NrnA [Halodesulfurarchaeum sp.]